MVSGEFLATGFKDCHVCSVTREVEIMAVFSTCQVKDDVKGGENGEKLNLWGKGWG